MQISLNEIERFLQTVLVLQDQVDSELLVDQTQEDLLDYRLFHARRLWRSLEILSHHLPSDRPIRVLELGAMPYYFTAILLRYFPEMELIGANTEGRIIHLEKSEEDRPRNVRLSFAGTDEGRDVDVHVLNLELDPFPFGDGSFDAVICMEVIEHLIYSPTHLLAETHRVLAPGGVFFLTTPNAVDMKRTMAPLLNRATGFPYSGYSIYGRHNREFTIAELERLVRACGFSIVHSGLENVHHRRHYSFGKRAAFGAMNLLSQLPIPYLQHKKEYIFVTAKSTGEVKWEYPPELYLFRHLYPHGH